MEEIKDGEKERWRVREKEKNKYGRKERCKMEENKDGGK